jgi:hypothetical protein
MISLKEPSLYQKPEKCECHKKEAKYLGLIVRVNRIRMDPDKVQAVENWEALEKLKKYPSHFRLCVLLMTQTESQQVGTTANTTIKKISSFLLRTRLEITIHYPDDGLYNSTSASLFQL